MKKILAISWFVLTQVIYATAQVENVGKIVSYKKLSNGIEGKTTSCIFDVRAYNEDVIRVRISRNKELNNFSYALVSNEIPAFNTSVEDKGKSIEITTHSLWVIIEKEPSLRITFKNKAGEIINEDMPGIGFGTTFIGSKVSSYKKLQDGERFVGLGETLGNLDKRGSGFTLNNTDTYKYGDPRLSMYISIPFFIGVHHQQLYGLFYNNTYKTFFNFGLSTPFTSINAEGGDADYFLIYGKSIAQILDHYSVLTGRMPLPPIWSIGYHQSRCTYYPQERVMTVAETFRKKNIPVDCIVLDADYLQDYEPFRINKERFPDLAGLAAHLKKMNIELTASVNPGIKIDSTYDGHLDGLKQDVFVKYTDGNLFVSDIAPSTNHFVDFTNPRGRQWWIDKMKFLPDNGIHGYWNDMNEPAVNGSYLPDNLQFDFDGRKANALEAKNVYGFQMARSSYESALRYGNGRRPFILTRSAFAGVQRYSAVWSGDNTAKDEYLLQGVLLNSQMGLSGIPFVGPDLGGYIGDGTKDLFKRWIEVGIFSPFVRNHKEYFASANEPWSYGEEAEAISKAYIGFRYRLLPYVYSTFYQASQSGMPIARSLCVNDPFDDKVYDQLYQYQFLFGDALLIVPVTTQENMKKVYLPEGEWYDLFTEEKLSGKKELIKQNPVYQIPIYIKASSIIPMQTLVQSTKEKPSDTLFIHIYNGTRKNEFVYYEDAGDGQEYQKGDFCKRTILFDPDQKRIMISPQTGSYHSVFKKIQVFLHGFGTEPGTVSINNKSQPLQLCSIKLLDPLEYLEDYYDKSFFKSLRDAEPPLKQKTFIFDHATNEITIQL
ncbi:MAG TPA: glycoside hydrolase family 31 protein [Puia sp.]|nr:glycoside hydrolase family 31 protein [Puia sp.]